MAHAHFMNLALAVKYGTNESLFLTNLCFWIEKNKANKAHFHKNHYWVYNTMDAWAELFPYFTKDQIRHLVNKMKKQKILLVDVFNRVRYDRTQWYSVSDEVMALYAGQGNGNGKRGSPEDKAEDAVPAICPPGQMEVGHLPHPSAPKGACIWEKSQIEAVDFPDRSGESPTTIPDNKPINKPTVAAPQMAKQLVENSETNNKETTAAVSFSPEVLKSLFSTLDSSLLFDTEFYPKAAAYLAHERLNENYLFWLYEECRRKKPENLRGLYYSLFFQPDMQGLFRNTETAALARKAAIRYVDCPVCGTHHPANELSCPECKLNRDDALDENKVRRHKKYYALSPEDKEAYKQDQSALFFQFAKTPTSYQAVHDAWMEIDKKFHLLE